MKTMIKMLLATTALMGTIPAQAADVSWTTPTNDSGNAGDVNTSGTLFAARTTGATTTLNGVTFVSGFDAQIALDGVEAITSEFSNPTFADASYNTLVGTGAFSGADDPFNMMINGLTIGKTYSLQIFTPFWDSNWATAFTGGGVTSGLVNLSGPDGGAGASLVPQNLYGTFVADSTSQRINLSSPTEYVLVAAAQVRDISVLSAVPEPATWGMMIAGFGMIGAAMRTRRRSTKVTFA